FDVHGEPVGIQPRRAARRLAQELVAAVRIGRETDHQALADKRAAPALALELLRLFAQPTLVAGDFAQSEFAQRRQIRRAKKILERRLDPLRRINLPLPQTLAQLLDRYIHHDDPITAMQELVVHGAAHLYAGHPAHHLIEALEMLNVEGGDHVDARGDQLFDILVALVMTRAWG